MLNSYDLINKYVYSFWDIIKQILNEFSSCPEKLGKIETVNFLKTKMKIELRLL